MSILGLKNRILVIHFWALGFLTLAGIVLLLSRPASPQNQVIFSFSLPQILFSLGWLIMAAACFYLARLISRPDDVIADRLHQWLENPRTYRLVLLGAVQLQLLAFVALFFNLPVIFGGLTGYLIRLRPFIAWLVLLTLHIISTMTFLHYKKLPVIRLGINRRQWITFLVFLFLFCGLWAVISFTGFGVGTNDDPIRTPTIYITFQEFFIALLVTCQVWVAAQFGKHVFDSEQQRNLKLVSPLLLGLVIWSVAVFLWINEPMRSSYYRIGPFPPNGDYIPAADPTRFDLPGQLALIGEGLNAGKYIDNPFYVFMVMLFRMAGGQFYDRMITYQIALLALTPVCLFFIGRMFSGPYLGLLLAVLTIIREKNIIRYSADTWMSPVKALLTEPFITFLLVLFCLYLIKWLRDQGSSPGNLALAGGIFGLSTLVRTNPWFLLPVSLAVIFLRMRFKPGRSFSYSIIFGSAVLASIFPWMLRSQATIETPFYFLFKMQHSVVEERYQKASPKENKLVPPALSLSKEMAFPGEPTAESQQQKSLVGIIGEHFVFNFVNTVQILPTLLPNNSTGTPVVFPTSVFTEGRAVSPGRMFTGNLSLLFILVCLSLGISTNNRLPFLAVIFPLVFFLTYSAGTAVALTSASRYTQPIEWVVLLYFSAGLFLLGQTIAKPFLEILSDPESLPAVGQAENPPILETKTSQLKSYAPILVLFLVIGSLIPLADFIFPKIYTIQPKEEMISQLDIQRLAASTGVSEQDYLAYLNQPATNIIKGRLIYTQYYRGGEGEDMSRMRDLVYSYPRLTFELLGPYKPNMNVLLPLEAPWPNEYLNGQTAVVIGCSSGGGLDASSVFLPDIGLYLFRTPGIPQDCQ